jgi:transposase
MRVLLAWKSQDFSNTLLEVFWLPRGLTPDFKTIADFRKDNRGAFKLVFRQFVLLCRKLELFGGGRFEAFSTDVKDRSRKSRFSTFEWRSEFFIACGYSISWES